LQLEEEMVRLHHQIVALRPHEMSRSLLFIGSREDEGTSTIAREFARVSATHFSLRVLLLESVQDAPADVPYVDTEPVQVGSTTLSVAGLPRELTAPSHVTDAQGVAAMWDRLRQGRDLIVIDAPPATRSPEGLALVSQVDGVVLVVEAECTRWPVAARTKESIVRSGGRVLGVVFNKRRLYIPAFLYDWL
jgi:Flp pilus assembly CpaE family ATPase